MELRATLSRAETAERIREPRRGDTQKGRTDEETKEKARHKNKRKKGEFYLISGLKFPFRHLFVFLRHLIVNKAVIPPRLRSGLSIIMYD